MVIKLPRNLGMLLLAIWLVLWGVFGLFSINFGGRDTLLQALALAAGVVLFLQNR